MIWCGLCFWFLNHREEFLSSRIANPLHSSLNFAQTYIHSFTKKLFISPWQVSNFHYNPSNFLTYHLVPPFSMTYFLFLSVKSVSFFEVKSHKWPCETMKKCWLVLLAKSHLLSVMCTTKSQEASLSELFDFSLSFLLLLLIILHLLHLCHFLLARVSVGRSVFFYSSLDIKFLLILFVLFFFPSP